MDPRDLAHQLATEGGFSVSSAGRPARSGQMVARAGTEHIEPGIASESQIAEYQSKHAVAMSRRGYYMGGWVEDTPEGKQTVLDVSQRFPTRVSAQLQGAIQEQRAIYDVDKDYAPTVNPVLPTDWSSFDIEEVHHPQIRNMTQIMGERARRAGQGTYEQGQLDL